MLDETKVSTDASPTTANTEIELKLSADSKSLAQVRRTAFWSGSQRAQTRVLDSVYFDTIRHDLRARGFSLRLRKVGRRFRQTLKTAGKAGYFERAEYETDLPEGRPNLTEVPDAAVRAQLEDISPDELKPIFTTHVRRSRKLYQAEEGTAVEIALDEGEVRDDEHAAPLSEIELELKEGPPETLFKMARELSGVIPVRLQTQSKPEIGYSLRDQGKEAWRSAGKIKLDGDMTVEASLDAIIEYCASHVLNNDVCARERMHIEGVHQVRVGLRRLRSGLQLLKKVLPAKQYRWIDGEAKVFAQAYGPAREFDVFREEILPSAAARMSEVGDFAALDEAAARLQDQAYEMVRDALTSSRFTTFMIELMRWRKTRSWRNQTVNARSALLFSPITELSTPILAKRYKSALRKGRGFADLPLEKRHDVRIQIKKLHYATNFFSSLYQPKRRKVFVKRLGALQDDLGHLNDVVTLSEVLGRILERTDTPQSCVAAGCLIGWYEHEIAREDQHLVQGWAAFERATPFWD